MIARTTSNRNPLPWFPFYATDFLSGPISGLSDEAQLAWIRLRAWSWVNGPLPESAAARARLAGVSTRKLGALWKEGLGGHFAQQADQTWVDPELEQLRERQAEKAAKKNEHDELQRLRARLRWLVQKGELAQGSSVEDVIALERSEGAR